MAIYPFPRSFLAFAALPTLFNAVDAHHGFVNKTITSWTPEPDGRGTLGILLMCGLSLGLCVWTALHLNIQPASIRLGLKVPPNFIGKATWAFIVLVAPELVSTVAVHQYLVMNRYRKHVNDTLGRERKDIHITRQKAFFAVMGGLSAVELSQNPYAYHFTLGSNASLEMGASLYSTDVSPRATKFIDRPPRESDVLIPVRLDSLVTPEWTTYVCRILDSEIKIRSKADGLAKFIVCTQAAWVMLQCLARAFDKLPLTPLELTTTLHISNLLIMYIAWWTKPVDPGRSIMPIRVQHSHEDSWKGESGNYALNSRNSAQTPSLRKFDLASLVLDPSFQHLEVQAPAWPSRLEYASEELPEDTRVNKRKLMYQLRELRLRVTSCVEKDHESAEKALIILNKIVRPPRLEIRHLRMLLYRVLWAYYDQMWSRELGLGRLIYSSCRNTNLGITHPTHRHRRPISMSGGDQYWWTILTKHTLERAPSYLTTTSAWDVFNGTVKTWKNTSVFRMLYSPRKRPV